MNSICRACAYQSREVYIVGCRECTRRAREHSLEDAKATRTKWISDRVDEAWERNRP